MNRLLYTIPIILVSSSAAFAVSDILDIDTNNDDFANYDELSAVYNGLTMQEFREIDTNGDNRISSLELYDAEAQQILSRYTSPDATWINVDTDGDGFADYEEMTMVFDGLSQSDFELIDANDDNRLSQFEIYDVEAQAIIERYPFMEDIRSVAELDVDGNNFLSESEMMTAFPGLSAADFERIDTNGDNRVSFVELYDEDAQNLVSQHEN